jgi:tRNA (cmo5U34)-methyltransferase
MLTFMGSSMRSSYRHTTQSRIPCVATLHRIAHILQAESIPPHGALLLVAGSDLELIAFAPVQSGW